MKIYDWDYKSSERTGSWGNKELESTESWGDKELEPWLEKGELRSLRARGDHSSCCSESGLEPPQLLLLSLLPQLQEHPPSFLMTNVLDLHMESWIRCKCNSTLIINKKCCRIREKKADIM